jgi:hypothetical protein
MQAPSIRAASRLRRGYAGTGPADNWADRGRIRPDTFEGIELARLFDQIEVVNRVGSTDC